jgi:hypothetical protein
VPRGTLYELVRSRGLPHVRIGKRGLRFGDRYRAMSWCRARDSAGLTITIRARPAEIWPWLVQMGCRRAGWYSYDGLDNGGVPSAERIVPELQRAEVGESSR